MLSTRLHRLSSVFDQMDNIDAQRFRRRQEVPVNASATAVSRRFGGGTDHPEPARPSDPWPNFTCLPVE
jgi:hypothetical protein